MRQNERILLLSRCFAAGAGFLCRCTGQLTPGELQSLKDTLSAPKETDLRSLSVAARWDNHERALRRELARLRTARLGGAARSRADEDGSHPDARFAAARAFDHESIRAAEVELDRVRWRFLDELEFGHYFDLERLFLYGLKLRLLERWAKLDKVKGRKRLTAFQSHAEDISRQSCERSRNH